MKNPFGILILLVCGAAGVGLAICIATTLEPADRELAALVASEQAASAPKAGAATDAIDTQRVRSDETVSESSSPEASDVPEPAIAVVEAVIEPIAEPAPPPAAKPSAKRSTTPKSLSQSNSNRPVDRKNNASFVSMALPGPTGDSGSADLNQAMQAFQNADPATQQILRESAGKLLDDPAALSQMLKGTGMENALSNPAMLEQVRSMLAGQQPAVAGPPTAAPQPAPAPREEMPLPVRGAEQMPPPVAPRERITHTRGPEGDDQLSITIQDEDLRQVLEFLSEQGGLNILASANVQGKVSAVLKGVDAFGALDAILKSTGFVMRREGKFIYVGTPKDFAELRMALDHVGTRVYRPNYVTAKELQMIITPLLTPVLGKVSVSAPAGIGIIVNSNDAGGDSPAHGEAVLVQDYEAVLVQVDEVVQEIDRRPLQVHIEAMVIGVTLNDANQFGVNFQWLRNEQNVRLGSGVPRIAPLDGTGKVDPATGAMVNEYNFNGGGLQFAFLDASLGMFLTAIETVGDINVIATPRLLVLNKQRAEILIGSQIPYTTSTVTQTFTTQTVQFLDIGTQLRLRPYVSSDGSIRMEVHPEVSSEGPIFDGIPSKNLTEVTTNIMCYDGCTVVIGGLMQEDLQSNFTQIPFLGSLPVVGPLFRQKNDTNVRREILVLVTPRIIYEPEYDNESIAGQNEFVERETVAADSQILLGRSVSARRFIRSAMAARDAGNFTAARRYANLAVRFDPNNRSAIDLRDELNAMQPEMHSVIDRPPQQVLPGGTVPTTPRVPNLVVPGEPLPGDPEILPPEPGAPESIEAVEPPPMGMRFVPVPSHPVRPGVPGRNAEIFKPGAFNNEPYPADQN
ncbi:MAG TPA: hypothetical protein VG713_09710 [Pirellulales bacterium]|nr:hypothetical protein [Pirellulales bacterium]